MISKNTFNTRYFKSCVVVMDTDADAQKEQFFDLNVPSGVKFIELKAIGYHVDKGNNKALHLYKITTNIFSEPFFVHSSDSYDFLQIYEGVVIPSYNENYNGRFSLKIDGILMTSIDGGGLAYYTPVMGVIVLNFLMHYD